MHVIFPGFVHVYCLQKNVSDFRRNKSTFRYCAFFENLNWTLMAIHNWHCRIILQRGLSPFRVDTCRFFVIYSYQKIV